MRQHPCRGEAQTGKIRHGMKIKGFGILQRANIRTIISSNCAACRLPNICGSLAHRFDDKRASTTVPQLFDEVEGVPTGNIDAVRCVDRGGDAGGVRGSNVHFPDGGAQVGQGLPGLRHIKIHILHSGGRGNERDSAFCQRFIRNSREKMRDFCEIRGEKEIHASQRSHSCPTGNGQKCDVVDSFWC